MRSKFSVWLVICMTLILFAATRVSAYTDCTPSTCPSGYTDNGITCSGNTCVRDCIVNVCSGNWTQAFSSSCGWTLTVVDEKECSTTSYNSSDATYCYNFTYDGPGTVLLDAKPDPPSGHTDCDTEGIGGFFDNAKNTPTPWFDNLTGHLGDVAYTSMDYLWKGSRAHAQSDSDQTYESDIALDGRIVCAPNTIACNQIGQINEDCSINCYNHKTFAYGYQGYVDDDTPTSDSTSENNNNLYRNAGCGTSNVNGNKLQDVNFYVYQANLTLQYNDQTCYRTNEAPNASSVLVLPTSADAGDNLFCNYTYSDPENFTELNSFYEWWKNSVNQSINSQVLLKGNLTPTDVWYCKVMPSDGLANGTKVQSSNNVTVAGTVKEPVLYVNGTQVWSTANYYSDSEWIVNFDAQLVNALANCTADAEGYCNVNLTLYSGAAGLMNISSMEIYYDLPQPTVVSLKIQSLSQIYSNGTNKVFEFVMENNGTSAVNNVTWKLNLGDGTIVNSTYNTSLAVAETVRVYAAYNYSSEGDYTVTANATAIAEGVTATKTLVISSAGTLSLSSLKVLYSNLSEKVFEFAINNSGDNNISVNWTLNFGDGNVVSSVQNANLNSSKSLLVYVQHNYSAQGDYSIAATAQGGGLTASSSISTEVEYLGVSNFSVINSSGSLRTFEAYIRNYMTVNMTNVSWSLNTGNGIVSSTSPITLQPQEEAFVFVAYNYTSTGTFAANFTAVNGSWSDVEALNVTIT
ncbi:hypothetical protein HYY73_06355 [Candidatus Woesearchaeota archaeon]|nr:hypothetical protein [Candidatus Woesearchaeota archaeon]